MRGAFEAEGWRGVHLGLNAVCEERKEIVSCWPRLKARSSRLPSSLLRLKAEGTLGLKAEGMLALDAGC